MRGEQESVGFKKLALGDGAVHQREESAWILLSTTVYLLSTHLAVVCEGLALCL